MSKDELNGMIWMLTHWLLPAKATKDDAYALMDKALEEYKTGLTLRDKEWLCGHADDARTSFPITGCWITYGFFTARKISLNSGRTVSPSSTNGINPVW